TICRAQTISSFPSTTLFRSRVELTDVPEEAQEVFGRHAELRILGGGVDLYVDIEAAAFALQPTVEGAGDLEPVEGLELACEPRHVLGLVRLEMADHGPVDIEIGHLLGLPVRLLDLVLPQLVTAGFDGQADPLLGHGLADRQQF